jgi:hypothetical protein
MYGISIHAFEDWNQLVERQLDIIVDPFVFRLGEFLLEGQDGGPDRWEVLESDLGALVSFFVTSTGALDGAGLRVLEGCQNSGPAW